MSEAKGFDIRRVAIAIAGGLSGIVIGWVLGMVMYPRGDLLKDPHVRTRAAIQITVMLIGVAAGAAAARWGRRKAA